MSSRQTGGRGRARWGFDRAKDPPAASGRPAADRPVAGPLSHARRAAPHRRPGEARPTMAELTQAATVVTAVFTVVAFAGVLAPKPFAALLVALSLLSFAVGCAAFMIGFVRAVARSRVDVIDLPGLFFLAGSVDKSVQRRLLTLLGVQLIVGIVAASFRPFTSVAFSTLTPIFPLGLMAWCGATHGRFPARSS